jgi:hypothetical protein
LKGGRSSPSKKRKKEKKALQMKEIIILILFLLIMLHVYTLHDRDRRDGFALSPAPMTSPYVLLGSSFPFIGGANKVPDISYADVWWKYPVFRTGSYDQITNNIEWINSPENGQAMPVDFCDAFYGKRKQPHSNYFVPSPPVPDGSTARVGYFRSK